MHWLHYENGVYLTRLTAATSFLSRQNISSLVLLLQLCCLMILCDLKFYEACNGRLAMTLSVLLCVSEFLRNTPN